MRDRWPGSTHRRGATERVALHTGGLVYIYLARIYAFASLSSYHLQTGAISRWCLMTRWQRNTSVLHARDMSFSSIISLYSSISLLFSRMDGWMDGWMETGCIFYNSKDVPLLLLALFWRETSNGTWPGIFMRKIYVLYAVRSTTRDKPWSRVPALLGPLHARFKAPWKPLVTVEMLEERVELLVVWEKLENVSILTRKHCSSASEFSNQQQNLESSSCNLARPRISEAIVPISEFLLKLCR